VLNGRLARVDLHTGRELWVRDIGSRPGWWTVAGTRRLGAGLHRPRHAIACCGSDAGTGKLSRDRAARLGS
jgi:hypothetical protein